MLIIIIQFNAIEATMVQNRLILGHQKSQYPMSLGVRMSEGASAVERAVQSRKTSVLCEQTSGGSERVSGASERDSGASERSGDWPSSWLLVITVH